jgi:4-diphosphocytidyl-2-C-methyl-D-erythritol kinase
VLAESAPAKVNLTLHVLRRRADGYHELESLVAFAREADELMLTPGGALELEVQGPTAGEAGNAADNLVIKAVRELEKRIAGLKLGTFVLSKRLPVAAGVGGGSSDAAAALRLIARANDIALDDPRLFEAARLTGADVPVCLDPRARAMCGIGEILSEPLGLPELAAVLVNPRVAVSTKDVFARLQINQTSAPVPAVPLAVTSRDQLLEAVAAARNDLEQPAMTLKPVIADVLAALAKQSGCQLARMSGSGATCFGLFGSSSEAETAARNLAAAQPGWWVRSTVLC